MKLIVGLGNPGVTYQYTRHNVGFLVMDALAKKYAFAFKIKKSVDGEMAEGMIGDVQVLLTKPHTFMNVSGRTVQKLVAKHPLKPEDILAVYDDADLPFGDVRTKLSGSSGGHRGMQSIIDVFPVGTNLARVRVGIGRPDHPDVPLDTFVLQTWNAQEKKSLEDILTKSIEAIESWLHSNE